MIKKFNALILNSIKFSESSKIAKIFSREEGKFSVMVKGAFKQKSKFRNIFEPMNHVEFVAYFKENKDLHTVSEASINDYFSSKFHSIEAMASGFMIVEAIEKSQYDSIPNEGVFDSAIHHLELLTHSELKPEIVFLDFLLDLVNLSGFEISEPIDDYETCFSISESKFVKKDPEKAYFEFGEQSYRLFSNLVLKKPINEIDCHIKAFKRVYKFLLSYLSYHLDKKIVLKSSDLIGI